MENKNTEHINKFSLKKFFKEYLDLRDDKENELSTIDSIRKAIEFKGVNLWILVFAVFICSLGLNVNSTAVVIGAMLISPLMGPILGVGLSVGINDIELLKRSLKSLLITTTFSVIVSTMFFIISPVAEGQSELLARTSPSIYDVFIALLGGMGAFIAISTKEKGNVIPGAAIATALMPPLCTAGYGIATGNIMYFFGAFYLYFINTVFIFLSAFIGTKILHFHPKEFIDKSRAKRVHRIMIVIAISTMLPAGYLTINIIKDSLFETKVNRFITGELSFPDTHVIDKKIVKDKNGKEEIRIIMVGKEVSKDAINLAKSKMDEYKLNDIGLTVLQGVNNDHSVSSLRAMVMEDFYKNSEARLQQQAKSIDSLKNKLDYYQIYEQLSKNITPELNIFFPSIKSLALTRCIQYDANEQTPDTIGLALIKAERIFSPVEKYKLTEWLKKRTGSQKMQVIINNFTSNKEEN